MLHMYSETLSEKVEAGNDHVMNVFKFIADKKSSFTFSDYQEALEKDETLFDWLDRPKEMM